jgi:hypothetical protein
MNAVQILFDGAPQDLPRVLKGESVPINISDEKAMALEMATGKHIESGYYVASLTKEGLKLSLADPFTDTPLSQGSGIVLTKEDLQKELTVGYQMAGGKLSDVYQLETKGDTEIGGKPTLKREVVHDGEVLSREEVHKDKLVQDVGVKADGLITDFVRNHEFTFSIPGTDYNFKVGGDKDAMGFAYVAYGAGLLANVAGAGRAISTIGKFGIDVLKTGWKGGRWVYTKIKAPRASTSIPKAEIPEPSKVNLWAPDNKRSIYEYLSEKY